MKNVFVEGKKAATMGLSHMENPHQFGSEAHEEWAKGWLVGDDPMVYGHLAPVPEYVEQHGALVALICEAMMVDPYETPWEAGRLASHNGASLADNPYEPETVDGDEWDRGFGHGSLEKISKSALVEAMDLPELPTVQVRPNRSFWAVLNNLQVSRSLSVGELAKYIGIDQDRLVAAMTEFGFYDSDGIPLNEIVAA